LLRPGRRRRSTSISTGDNSGVFRRLLCESARSCVSRRIGGTFSCTPAFSATVFAIMMFWRDPCGLTEAVQGVWAPRWGLNGVSESLRHPVIEAEERGRLVRRKSMGRTFRGFARRAGLTARSRIRCRIGDKP
jgi:hypothetical protein